MRMHWKSTVAYDRAMFAALAVMVLCGLFAAIGCGGEAWEDAELEQHSEDLSVKPSSEYTYGVSTSPSYQKCTVAFGAGTGFSCIVPSRTTVRYKISGFDQFESDTTGTTMSWKTMVRRAYGSSITAYLDQGMPFTFVEQDTAQTWVHFTRGNCPGDPQGNHMNAFICWTPGSTVALTESLPGAYRKTTGVVTVTFDIDAIDVRAPHGTGYDENFHQLIEHAVHLGAGLPLGIGTAEFGSTVFPYPWSSRTVEAPTYPVQYKFDYQGWTEKEQCIIGSFNSMSPTTFTLLPGTCTD